MKVQTLVYSKCFVQLLTLFHFFNFGRCMSSSMMRTDSTAMGMTASGRDFADLDAAEAAVPRRPVIQNSDNVERVMFKWDDPNKELACVISNVVPTPVVAWGKDNQRWLGKDTSYFTTSFDPKTGIAKLSISTPPESTLKGSRRTIAKLLSGSYTCFAQNFLGQVKKTFQVQMM